MAHNPTLTQKYDCLLTAFDMVFDWITERDSNCDRLHDMAYEDEDFRKIYSDDFLDTLDYKQIGQLYFLWSAQKRME